MSCRTSVGVEHRTSRKMLLRTHVNPRIGALWVDRTRTDRVDQVFAAMADAGYATSTIDRTWGYLNQACEHAQRRRRIKSNPVEDVPLPHANQRAQVLDDRTGEPKRFTSFPEYPHPAMWLTTGRWPVRS